MYDVPKHITKNKTGVEQNLFNGPKETNSTKKKIKKEKKR